MNNRRAGTAGEETKEGSVLSPSRRARGGFSTLPSSRRWENKENPCKVLHSSFPAPKFRYNRPLLSRGSSKSCDGGGGADGGRRRGREGHLCRRRAISAGDNPPPPPWVSAPASSTPSNRSSKAATSPGGAGQPHRVGWRKGTADRTRPQPDGARQTMPCGQSGRAAQQGGCSVVVRRGRCSEVGGRLPSVFAGQRERKTGPRTAQRTRSLPPTPGPVRVGMRCRAMGAHLLIRVSF